MLTALTKGCHPGYPAVVATITAPLRWSWVVGQPKAHGQQKALTVATNAKREQNSCCGTDYDSLPPA
jgi:hypothetical protein